MDLTLKKINICIYGVLKTCQRCNRLQPTTATQLCRPGQPRHQWRWQGRLGGNAQLLPGVPGGSGGAAPGGNVRRREKRERNHCLFQSSPFQAISLMNKLVLSLAISVLSCTQTHVRILQVRLAWACPRAGHSSHGPGQRRA